MSLRLFLNFLLSDSVYLAGYWAFFFPFGDEFSTRWKIKIYLYFTSSHSIWPEPIFLEDSLFSNVYFWFLYQNSFVHRSLKVCLSVQFYSVDEAVYIFFSIMKILLLWLRSTIWIRDSFITHLKFNPVFK